MTVNDYIKQIESIGNSRDLGEVESALRGPFGEDFESDPAYRLVFDALARQERLVKEREAAGNKAIRQDELRAMVDAVKSVSVMGSGISVKKQGRGKTLRTPKGIGFSVPSGSSESLNAEGANDALKAPLGQFLNEYVLGHMAGNYVDPRGKNGEPQVLTHGEVVNDLGIVPPDIGKSALEKLLTDAANDGAIGSGDVADFGKQFGLSKAVQDRASVAIRKGEKESAGPSAAKTQKDAVAKIVGKVAADARKQVNQAFSGMIEKEKRIARLQGKQEGIRETETKFGLSPDAGAGDTAPASVGKTVPVTTGGDAPFDAEADESKRHTGFFNPEDAGHSLPPKGPPNDPPKGPPKKPKDLPMTFEGFKKLRAAITEDVKDEYTKDPNRRNKIDTLVFHRDVADRLRIGGVALPGDTKAEKKEQAEARADLDANMAAAHTEGTLKTEHYLAYLNSKSDDDSLPHTERRRAIRQAASIEAKGKAEQAREAKVEAAEKTRTAKVEAAEKTRTAKVEAAAFGRMTEKDHKSGRLTDQQYEDYLTGRVNEKDLPQDEIYNHQAKLASFQAERQEREEKAQAQEDVDSDPTTKFKRERAEAVWDVSNEFLSDPKKRKLYGGAKHKKAEQEELKRRDLLTEGDKKSGGKGGFDLYKGSLLVAEFTSAFRSGLQVGNAAGAVATGLTRAIVGAGSLFVHAGETALGLLLSPFGRTGSAVAHFAGGVGQAFLAALSVGGAVVSAGLKIGLGIAGGIALGLSAGIGAGFGAVVGLLTGIGPLAGAVAGAGLVAGIGAAVAGLLSTVGGAIGQMLGAIGTAFGQLGSALGQTIGSIQNVLGDLIATGKAFASASISVARGGNLSLGAAGGVGALASILTGSPGGLNNVFTGFGHMSQYQGDRLKAFGVAGATGTDPLGDIVKSANAYKGMDPIRRQLLVQGGYEGSQEIGNLFYVNSISPGIAAKAAKVAKDTALSPQEAVANYNLSLNLAEIQQQLDRLKTKLLTDLMPVINMGVNAFSSWFDQNQKGITAALANFGKFMATQFPGMLRGGINAVYEFGKSVASSLPVLAEWGKKFYNGFALLVSGLQIGLGAFVTLVGGVVEALTGKRAGQGIVAAGKGMIASPLMHQGGADDFFNGIGKKGAGWAKDLADSQKRTNKFLDGVGVKNESDAAFQMGLKNGSGGTTTNIYVHTTSTQHHTIDMTRLQHSVVEHVSEQSVRAFQRAGA